MDYRCEIKEPPSGQYADLTDIIRIEKYRNSRYWGVWVGEELLTVTVYKKGAVAVKKVLCCEKVSGV